MGHRNQYRSDEHLEQGQFADHQEVAEPGDPKRSSDDQEVAEPGDPKRSSDDQAAAELDDQLR